MIDIIQGEKFIELGDFVYAPNWKSDCNKVPHTFNKQELFENAIIYTHTMYVLELFKELQDIDVSIILVTHNSDTNITPEIIKCMPMCIKKWFTQNVGVNHTLIESIPIGLENNKWLQAVCKIGIMRDVLNTSKRFKNVVYVNHNVKTNLSKRLLPYELFANHPWFTIEHGTNGKNFETYIENVYNHSFVICPEGNGVDTHRIWEALYMNTIPIIIRNFNTVFYEDLPICFINSWEELSESFLDSEYTRIKECKTWNMEKLKMQYWRNKIVNT